MRKDKRYVMIITSEDERYDEDMSLSNFAEDPSQGLLVDILFGNTFEELYGDGEYEGLFYLLYEIGTGKRIGAGVLDPDGPPDEIDAWEAEHLTLESFHPPVNNSKTIGQSIYTIQMKRESGNERGWFIREENNRACLPTHRGESTPTFDLQEVLDRYNSITEELELIDVPFFLED